MRQDGDYRGDAGGDFYLDLSGNNFDYVPEELFEHYDVINLSHNRITQYNKKYSDRVMLNGTPIIGQPMVKLDYKIPYRFHIDMDESDKDRKHVIALVQDAIRKHNMCCSFHTDQPLSPSSPPSPVRLMSAYDPDICHSCQLDSDEYS